MRRRRLFLGGGSSPRLSVVSAPVNRSSRVAVAPGRAVVAPPLRAYAGSSAARPKSQLSSSGSSVAAISVGGVAGVGLAASVAFADAGFAVSAAVAGRRRGRRTGGAGRRLRCARRRFAGLPTRQRDRAAHCGIVVRGRLRSARAAGGVASGRSTFARVRQLAEQIREGIVERRRGLGHVRRAPVPGGRVIRRAVRCSSRHRARAGEVRRPRPGQQCYEKNAGFCPSPAEPHAPRPC